jgi:hypothetical protein
LFLLLCGLVGGCGKGMGEVSGTVTYKKKPVPMGNVQFLGSDGKTYIGEIQSDGTYNVRVPSGEAKVAISAVDDSKMVEMAKKFAEEGKGAGEKKKIEIKKERRPRPRNLSFSLIPERYNEWGTSGLTMTVKRGKNTKDFELTD